MQLKTMCLRSTGKSAAISFWLICLCLICGGVLMTSATDRYVTPPGGYGTNNPPYTNWADAATNIQWAISACSSGDVVWVTNGNFTLTNHIEIATSNITMKSVNGRDYTFINGNAWTRGVTNRCIYITKAGVVVDGFTVTNGNMIDQSGGGLYAGANATVINCTFRTNFASWQGGGVFMLGVISNCIVEQNIVGNGAKGGGIYAYGALIVENCTVRNNYRGGIRDDAGGSVIRNCVVTHNNAGSNSGNTRGGITYYKNTIVENCTIVSNYVGFWVSGQAGGGIGPIPGATNAVIRNCIIYSNTAFEYPDWITNDSTGTIFSSCCSSTTNGMEGSGNITNWPKFVDYSATNYQLAANSPCVNTGTNRDWMTNAVDLDGKTRIRYGTVDMGAYERIYEGSVYSVR